MMEELKYRIKEHEGFRDTVYQDHLGNATVGWGHLVTSDDNFQVGITYPEEVLEAVFEKAAFNIFISTLRLSRVTNQPDLKQN